MALYVTRPRRDEERIGRGLPSGSIGRGRLGDRNAREICHIKGLNFIKLNLSITVYSSVKVCFVRLWVFLLLHYSILSQIDSIVSVSSSGYPDPLLYPNLLNLLLNLCTGRASISISAYV